MDGWIDLVDAHRIACLRWTKDVDMLERCRFKQRARIVKTALRFLRALSLFRHMPQLTEWMDNAHLLRLAAMIRMHGLEIEIRRKAGDVPRMALAGKLLGEV